MFRISTVCSRLVLVVSLTLLFQRSADAYTSKPWLTEERLFFGDGSRGGFPTHVDVSDGRSFTSLSEEDPEHLRLHSLSGLSLLAKAAKPWSRQHVLGRGEGMFEDAPMRGGGPHGLLDFTFVCVFLAFALNSMKEWNKFREMQQARFLEAKVQSAEVIKKDDDAIHEITSADLDRDAAKATRNWSPIGLVCLTAYRFYTGFLSATWLPYLLAMEGEDLWRQNQSLFMGVAKLIYGVTILINPIMGRIGDRAVVIDHGLGRRLFVRCGICISAVGIFVCLTSAHAHMFYPFLFGIFLWRLGEACNDVTTEAIIPEMVPPGQYQLAGSVKAASFLLGGLLGYVMLILLVDLHYSWLYYAYLIGMLTCAMPALVLLGMESDATANARKRVVEESLWDSVWQAYVQPTQYKGGFPRFSLATFIFTLGTSPMFFLLLMVRDLIGVTNPTDLQRMFSWFSIVFFISAAVASVLSGLGAPKRAPPGSAAADEQTDKGLKELKVRRWHMLVHTQITFGLIVLCVPGIAWAGPTELKIKVFFIVSVIFGACFGSGYSRFQDAAWQVLPTGDRGQANAMGFNTMCRLLGVGMGNFVAGLMLDCFYTGNALPTYHQETATERINSWLGLGKQEDNQVYMTIGYVLMCASCAICNFISAAVTRSIVVDGDVGCKSEC